MPDELIAEFHDIGKLIDHDALATVIPDWPQAGGGHNFTNRADEPIDLTAFGLPQPTGPTWHGIVNHHERIRRNAELADTRVRAWQGDPSVQAIAPQLLLLMAADHVAASTSRAGGLERGERGDRWPDLKAIIRQRIWHGERRSGPSSLLTTPSEVTDLLHLVGGAPSALTEFWEQYGDRLLDIPEDKGFPRAVTTLATHLRLTGQYFRILRRASSLRRRPDGRSQELAYLDQGALSCAHIETRWRFRLVRCTVELAASHARLHDVGVFTRLENAINVLKGHTDLGDHVLFTTFQHLWLFLPLEERCTLADVLEPILSEGFHIDVEVLTAPLGTITQWDAMDVERANAYRYFQPELPATIVPPLCDVCQLGAGQAYQGNADDPVEYLCERCRNTREQDSRRFSRLGSWDKGDTAAWLRVFLDFDALDTHLRDLFRQYVAATGKGQVDATAQAELAADLRTTALTVDYVNDFLAMQNDLAAGLQAVFREENVEVLGAERKEVMVVRLERRSEVFRLLQLCDTTARRHFPLSVAHPPFRVAISLGPVRFPFGEHWRRLQQAMPKLGPLPASDNAQEEKERRADVLVALAGGGRLACTLGSIPELVQLAGNRGVARRGLHRLADIAAESPALARVALADRNDRDLNDIAQQLAALGLDFESMAACARLTKD